MKRVLLVLLVLMTLGAMVHADVEIEVWLVSSNENARIVQDMTETMFSPQTGIWLDIQTMTWEDSLSRIYMALAAGEPPDLAQIGSTWSGEFGLRGAILDLQTAFGPEAYQSLANQMYPGAMRPLDFRGTAWGLPASIGNMISYVRTDIFDDFGWEVPHTWDEMVNLLPRMQARNKNAGLFYGGGPLTWFVASAFFRQAGGDIYQPGGFHSTLATPESIDGFIRYTNLFTKHGLPQDLEPFNMFRNGDIPFLTISTTVVYGSFEYASPELAGRWDVAMVPGTRQADGSINRTGYLGTNNFSIFEKARNPQAAWEWMQWWLSAPVQAEYAIRLQNQLQGAYHISPNVKAMNEAPIRPEHREIIKRQLDSDIGIPFSVGGEYVQRYVVNAIHRVVLQGADPVEAIKRASDETTAEMQRKQIEFKRFLDRLPE